MSCPYSDDHCHDHVTKDADSSIRYYQVHRAVLVGGIDPRLGADEHNPCDQAQHQAVAEG